MSRKFHQWVAAYQDDAWSLASYLLKDSSEAEDVTQEAFIKLWNERESVPEDRIRPWLLRVTRNACLDRLRHLKIVPELEPAEPATPESDAWQHELGLRLQESISRLEEPHRSLVVLRDIQQLAYDDIVRITSLSLSQVKVYLHRARLELREQLSEVRR